MRPWPYFIENLKAIQAVAYLLKQADDNQYNYVDILKMYYRADIRSFAETTYSIARVGGELPVPSHPLTRDWTQYFTRKNVREPEETTIELKEDPGVGELCPYEADLLEEIFEEVKNES